MQIIFTSEKIFTPLRIYSHLVSLVVKPPIRDGTNQGRSHCFFCCWSDNKLEPAKLPLKHQAADIKNSTANYLFVSIMQHFLKKCLRFHFPKPQKCCSSILNQYTLVLKSYLYSFLSEICNLPNSPWWENQISWLVGSLIIMHCKYLIKILLFSQEGQYFLIEVGTLHCTQLS